MQFVLVFSKDRFLFGQPIWTSAVEYTFSILCNLREFTVYHCVTEFSACFKQGLDTRTVLLRTLARDYRASLEKLMNASCTPYRAGPK